MGVSNFTSYTPTTHCIQRANERFGVFSNSTDVTRFFLKHAPRLKYKRSTEDSSISVYADEEITFVLDTLNFKIVTCYATEIIIDKVREDYQAEIEKEINSIVRSHQVKKIKEFCENQKETLKKLSEIAETLPNSRRGDLVDSKVKELLELSKTFTDGRGELIATLEKLKEYKYD